VVDDLQADVPLAEPAPGWDGALARLQASAAARYGVATAALADTGLEQPRP